MMKQKDKIRRIYKIKFSNTYAADFETTVYDEQTFTEVWASAIVPLYTEDVFVSNNISDFFEYLFSKNENSLVYFHNIKFDGSFIIYHLLKNLKYTQAYTEIGDKIEWMLDHEMPNNSFKYVVSFMGQWYRILIKHNGHYIELRDSYKLLPFTLKNIGISFQTKHQKTSIEYKGYREAYGYISQEEREYISNDVLVLKEALEMLFEEGHNRLTIGSCCMAEFKKVCDTMYRSDGVAEEFTPVDREMKKDFHCVSMPYLYDIEIPEEYGYKNAGDYIRSSYRGGWCYLAKGKENKIFHNGTTADVNSLYPSMMHSESGNKYPIGVPEFYKGYPDYIRRMCNNKDSDYYCFVRFRTRFHVKPNKLPFISIKTNPFYPANRVLETSNIYNKRTGTYVSNYKSPDGVIHEAIPELCLAWNEYELFCEHYFMWDTEYLDCCVFSARKGMFDQYIDKYKKIKMESKGAKRTLAKLFLNNLYGKLAASTNSSFKVIFLREDNSLGFRYIRENNKRAGYIAMGSAVTAYAREFTIRAAQANYYGKNKRGFIYADTDSIHCDLNPEEMKAIKIDENNFCCWKLESSWDEALFVRPKTYIEHIVANDLKPCDPYYDIKCAGMPQQCKNLFVENITRNYRDNYTDEEKLFMSKQLDITDFKIGLQVPSKLLPKQIEGGVVLLDTTFTMKEGL